MMQPSNEERTLAALAHASIVLNSTGLLGLVAAGAIWASQRERSAYVRGHALQALAYQILVLVIALLLMCTWALCLPLSLLPTLLRPELYQDSLPLSFWLVLVGLIIPIVFGVFAVMYSLFGAVQTYRQRPFRYPLVGRFGNADLSPAPTPAPLPETPAPAIPAASETPAVAVAEEPATIPDEPPADKKEQPGGLE